MIEPNDRVAKEAWTRSRRRKSAAWKSGLMLTGLGAVVVGAGYLAGVNAPAVAQSSTPQAVAQTGTANPAGEENGLRTEGRTAGSNAGSFLGYDEDGNAVYLGSDGGLVFRGDDDFDENENRQQFQTRPSRQSRAQQQPLFGGPVTRSRGS